MGRGFGEYEATVLPGFATAKFKRVNFRTGKINLAIKRVYKTYSLIVLTLNKAKNYKEKNR